MDHSINIYKDVITSELCDELISLHKREKEYTEKEVYGEGANVGCYGLELGNYPEYNKKVFYVDEGIIDSVLEDHVYFPDNLDYDQFSGLSNEVKAKFKKIRPKTMGQALRIDGVTPAAVYILLSHVKRKSIKHIA